MTKINDPNQGFDINNPPPIDPKRFVSWKDQFLKRTADRKARIAAQKSGVGTNTRKGQPEPA